MLLRPPNRVLILVLCWLCVRTVYAHPPASPPNSREITVLTPKLQKELGKALEALRDNKLAEARKHLDVVHRVAPADTETNFLLGVYSSQLNDWVQAKSFFESVLAASPNHLGALLSLGSVLLQEQNPVQAAQYFKKAVDVEPTSWRAHAALADACMRQGMLEEAIQQSERAMELGHSRAEIVLPLLSQALALRGDKEEAAIVFQTYLDRQSKDASSAKSLAAFRDGSSRPAVVGPLATLASAPPVVTTAGLLNSNWLPPDIDEVVPPVEPGMSCDLDKVLDQSAKRVQEFVASVDRFTATEAVIHESISKLGLASRRKKLEFDYLVSIKENRPGLLSVDEYRNAHYRANDFPDGIATTGLSALLLIFHPYYAQDFSMACEGLSRSNGRPAWQVYFRQRQDRPSVIRTYQSGGPQGRVYAVALKGRAWIAADSFQILRMETDLVTPLPQIRLVTDRAAIEYGPVHFRSRNLDMWLPQTAEIFYEWRGRRSHRRHSFENYLLYSVDDKQQIAVPSASPRVTQSPVSSEVFGPPS